MEEQNSYLKLQEMALECYCYSCETLEPMQHRNELDNLVNLF